MALVSYKKHPILHELVSTISDPKERVELVDKLLTKYPIDEEPERIKFAILELLANYIVFSAVKAEKEETRKLSRDIITPSKETTINKREISMQRLQESAEYEEVIETHINEDKNTILSRSQKVTDHDKKQIPFLANIDETIQNLRYKVKNNVMSAKDANTYKQIIIELESDKYIVEEAYKKPIHSFSFILPKSEIDYNSDTGYYYTDKNGEEKFKTISENCLDFFNPKTWAELIKLYGPLKESTWENLNSDMHWIIMTFEDIVDSKLKYNYPVYFDMLCWRIDKILNKDIIVLLQEKYDEKHTDVYISTTLMKTIPNLLAIEYQKQWIIKAYYKPHFLLAWKTCSCCRRIKPRLPFFWTKNSSGDGFYSKCKECRNGGGAKVFKHMRKKPVEGFNEGALLFKIYKEREAELEEKESKKKAKKEKKEQDLNNLLKDYEEKRKIY